MHLPHLVGLIESVLPTTQPAATAHHSQPHLLPNPLSHLILQTNTSATSPSYSLTTPPSPPAGYHRALDDEKPSSDGLPSPDQAPSSDSPQKHISSGKPPPAPASQATERSQKPGKARNLHHQHVKLII